MKPYYQKDNFTLYNGDCLKVLEKIPENSVDMIFADPPYLLSNGGFTVHAGNGFKVLRNFYETI